MEFSKQWVILVCVVCVACGVVSTVVEKSSASKAFNFLCGAVVIYTIMLPLISQKFEPEKIGELFTQNTRLSENFESEAQNTVQKAVQSGYESLFKKTLLQNDISFERLEVKCSQKGEGTTLEKVIISGVGDRKTKRKIESLFNELVKTNFELEFE